MNVFASAYSSFYWCLFPVRAEEEAVPRLYECQDSLQDRLSKLRDRESELTKELLALRNSRDRSKLRRVWMERRSIVRDTKVTENTLWTIERQLALFERSELDSLVINSLKASTHALQEMAEKGGYTTNEVEEITDALQQRMQEAHDITEGVTNVLRVGLEEDMDSLDRDLEAFLNGDDEALHADNAPSVVPGLSHCAEPQKTRTPVPSAQTFFPAVGSAVSEKTSGEEELALLSET